MKKILILLFVGVLAFGCETQQEKKERLLREKVFESEYLKKSMLDCVNLDSYANLMKEKSLGSKKELIFRYNYSLGVLMGRSENIDTIINRVERNSELLKSYVVADAFCFFAQDSLLYVKYKREQDSIAQMIR